MGDKKWSKKMGDKKWSKKMGDKKWSKKMGDKLRKFAHVFKLRREMLSAI